MLDELLRLAGFDLNARVTAWKVEAEDRAQHAVAQLKATAQTFAVQAGCYAAAGLMGLGAFVVLLMLLYRAIEEAKGPWPALSVIALVLCICGLLLALVAGAVGRPRTKPHHILFDIPPATSPAYAVVVEPTPATGRTLGEFLAPLFAFITRHAPLTGNWAVDGVLRQLGSRSQASAGRALEHATEMVRAGSRPTMLMVLGSAGMVGWLLLRRRGTGRR